MLKLFAKQLVVGTPLSSLGKRLRWLANAPARRRHPELWDLYLEERRTAVALIALVAADSVCVDVGAHIGSVLAEFCRLAPHGHHVAFEPTPSKARWLVRRFPSVRVVDAAVADAPGVAPFFDDLDRPGFSGLRQPVDRSTVRRYDVRVVTLDDELADLDRIDFIKIDVEGAELRALRGGAATLVKHRPAVLFECGPASHLARFDYKRADLFDYFAELGYDVYSMVDFVYGRQPMTRESFDKAGTYPYRGFNFLGLPANTRVARLL
jgi:FkbM family methyltransferase